MTKQISFEDIRKGDRIRAERVEGGITITREGVAHRPAFGGWIASEGGLIVGGGDEATITLLHRPVPAEPEGVGVVVETDSGVRLVSIDPYPNGNRWVLLWRSRRGTTEHTTAWTWEHLVRKHDSLTVVREGV